MIVKIALGRPWTAEEDDLLRDLAASGANPASIAIRLKRSQDAIQSRAFRLGIPLNRLKAKGK
jgi:hypothetical protein